MVERENRSSRPRDKGGRRVDGSVRRAWDNET